MIFNYFLNSAVSLFGWVFNLIVVDNNASIIGTVYNVSQFIGLGLNFFPADLFIMCLGNIIMWILLHMSISVVRFVLRFIPLMGG